MTRAKGRGEVGGGTLDHVRRPATAQVLQGLAVGLITAAASFAVVALIVIGVVNGAALALP
jgi:hypothetical protein